MGDYYHISDFKGYTASKALQDYSDILQNANFHNYFQNSIDGLHNLFLTASTRKNSSGTSSAYVQTVITELINLSSQNRFFVESCSTREHAMYMLIELQEYNLFDIYIFNTGLDIQFHQSKLFELRRLYLPFMLFRDVSLLHDLPITHLFFRGIYEMEKGELTLSPQVLYQAILSPFKSNMVGDFAEGNSGLLYVNDQFGGTCSFSALHQLVKYYLYLRYNQGDNFLTTYYYVHARSAFLMLRSFVADATNKANILKLAVSEFSFDGTPPKSITTSHSTLLRPLYARQLLILLLKYVKILNDAVQNNSADHPIEIFHREEHNERESIEYLHFSNHHTKVSLPVSFNMEAMSDQEEKALLKAIKDAFPMPNYRSSVDVYGPLCAKGNMPEIGITVNKFDEPTNNVKAIAKSSETSLLRGMSPEHFSREFNNQISAYTSHHRPEIPSFKKPYQSFVILEGIKVDIAKSISVDSMPNFITVILNTIEQLKVDADLANYLAIFKLFSMARIACERHDPALKKFMIPTDLFDDLNPSKSMQLSEEAVPKFYGLFDHDRQRWSKFFDVTKDDYILGKDISSSDRTGNELNVILGSGFNFENLDLPYFETCKLDFDGVVNPLTVYDGLLEDYGNCKPPPETVALFEKLSRTVKDDFKKLSSMFLLTPGFPKADTLKDLSEKKKFANVKYFLQLKRVLIHVYQAFGVTIRAVPNPTVGISEQSGSNTDYLKSFGLDATTTGVFKQFHTRTENEIIANNTLEYPAWKLHDPTIGFYVLIDYLKEKNSSFIDKGSPLFSYMVNFRIFNCLDSTDPAPMRFLDLLDNLIALNYSMSNKAAYIALYAIKIRLVKEKIWNTIRSMYYEDLKNMENVFLEKYFIVLLGLDFCSTMFDSDKMDVRNEAIEMLLVSNAVVVRYLYETYNDDSKTYIFAFADTTIIPQILSVLPKRINRILELNDKFLGIGAPVEAISEAAEVFFRVYNFHTNCYYSSGSGFFHQINTRMVNFEKATVDSSRFAINLISGFYKKMGSDQDLDTVLFTTNPNDDEFRLVKGLKHYIPDIQYTLKTNIGSESGKKIWTLNNGDIGAEIRIDIQEKSAFLLIPSVSATNKFIEYKPNGDVDIFACSTHWPNIEAPITLKDLDPRFTSLEYHIFVWSADSTPENRNNKDQEAYVYRIVPAEKNADGSLKTSPKFQKFMSIYRSTEKTLSMETHEPGFLRMEKSGKFEVTTVYGKLERARSTAGATADLATFVGGEDVPAGAADVFYIFSAGDVYYQLTWLTDSSIYMVFANRSVFASDVPLFFEASVVLNTETVWSTTIEKNPYILFTNNEVIKNDRGIMMMRRCLFPHLILQAKAPADDSPQVKGKGALFYLIPSVPKKDKPTEVLLMPHSPLTGLPDETSLKVQDILLLVYHFMKLRRYKMAFYYAKTLPQTMHMKAEDKDLFDAILDMKSGEKRDNNPPAVAIRLYLSYYVYVNRHLFLKFTTDHMKIKDPKAVNESPTKKTTEIIAFTEDQKKAIFGDLNAFFAKFVFIPSYLNCYASETEVKQFKIFDLFEIATLFSEVAEPFKASTAADKDSGVQYDDIMKGHFMKIFTVVPGDSTSSAYQGIVDGTMFITSQLKSLNDSTFSIDLDAMTFTTKANPPVVSPINLFTINPDVLVSVCHHVVYHVNSGGIRFRRNTPFGYFMTMFIDAQKNGSGSSNPKALILAAFADYIGTCDNRQAAETFLRIALHPRKAPNLVDASTLKFLNDYSKCAPRQFIQHYAFTYNYNLKFDHQILSYFININNEPVRIGSTSGFDGDSTYGYERPMAWTPMDLKAAFHDVNVPDFIYQLGVRHLGFNQINLVDSNQLLNNHKATNPNPNPNPDPDPARDREQMLTDYFRDKGGLFSQQDAYFTGLLVIEEVIRRRNLSSEDEFNELGGFNILDVNYAHLYTEYAKMHLDHKNQLDLLSDFSTLFKAKKEAIIGRMKPFIENNTIPIQSNIFFMAGIMKFYLRKRDENQDEQLSYADKIITELLAILVYSKKYNNWYRDYVDGIEKHNAAARLHNPPQLPLSIPIGYAALYKLFSARTASDPFFIEYSLRNFYFFLVFDGLSPRIIIRKNQWQDILKCYFSVSSGSLYNLIKNMVLQKSMGAGKTSVLSPMFSYMLSLVNIRVHLISPEPLLLTNAKELCGVNYSFFKQRGFIFSMNRDSRMRDSKRLIVMFYILNCHDSFTMSLSTYIQSIQNVLTEYLYKSLENKGAKAANEVYSLEELLQFKYLVEIMKILRDRTAGVIDEGDTIFNPSKELNFPTSVPLPMSQHIIRFVGIFHALFDQRYKELKNTLKSDLNLNDKQRAEGAITQRPQIILEVINKVVTNYPEYLKCHVDSTHIITAAHIYSSGGGNLTDLPGCDHCKKIEELQLYFSLHFVSILEAHEGVKYGLTKKKFDCRYLKSLYKGDLDVLKDICQDATEDSKTTVDAKIFAKAKYQALPYAYSDTPKEGSVFSHPWRTIGYTFQYYMIKDKPPHLLLILAQFYQKARAFVENQLKQNIKEDAIRRLPDFALYDAVFQDTVFDQKNLFLDQVIAQICDPSRIDMKAAVISAVVFEGFEIKNVQMFNFPLNLAYSFYFYITYSGTIPNKEIFSDDARVNQEDDEKMNLKLRTRFNQMINGSNGGKGDSDKPEVDSVRFFTTEISQGLNVFHNMFQGGAHNVHGSDTFRTHKICAYRAIIDVGAGFRAHRMENLANEILSMCSANDVPPQLRVKAVVFPMIIDDKDELIYRILDGGKNVDKTKQEMDDATRDAMLENTFAIYDQSHTVGTDIRLPKGARGLVVLSDFVTEAALYQAIMRLRRFADHEVPIDAQKVDFVSTKALLDGWHAGGNLVMKLKSPDNIEQVSQLISMTKTELELFKTNNIDSILHLARYNECKKIWTEQRWLAKQKPIVKASALFRNNFVYINVDRDLAEIGEDLINSLQYTMNDRVDLFKLLFLKDVNEADDFTYFNTLVDSVLHNDQIMIGATHEDDVEDDKTQENEEEKEQDMEMDRNEDVMLTESGVKSLGCSPYVEVPRDKNFYINFILGPNNGYLPLNDCLSEFKSCDVDTGAPFESLFTLHDKMFVSENYFKVSMNDMHNGVDNFTSKIRKSPSFIFFGRDKNSDAYNCLFLSYNEAKDFASRDELKNSLFSGADESNCHPYFLVEYVAQMVIHTNMTPDAIRADFASDACNLSQLYAQTLFFGGTWESVNQNYYNKIQFVKWLFDDHTSNNEYTLRTRTGLPNYEVRMEYFKEAVAATHYPTFLTFYDIYPQYRVPDGTYTHMQVKDWSYNLLFNNVAKTLYANLPNTKAFCLEVGEQASIDPPPGDVTLGPVDPSPVIGSAVSQHPYNKILQARPPELPRLYRDAYENLIFTFGVYDLDLKELLLSLLSGREKKGNNQPLLPPTMVSLYKRSLIICVFLFTVKKEIRSIFHWFLRRFKLRSTFNRFYGKFVRPIVAAFDRLYDKFPEIDDYTPNVPNLEAHLTSNYDEDPEVSGYKMLPEDVLRRLDMF